MCACMRMHGQPKGPEVGYCPEATLGNGPTFPRQESSRLSVIILCSSVGLLLPETTSSLVENGSNRSRPKWWQISWLSLA